ncbi:MAG: zinc ribbon domain-containing protein [Anaerolineae bacterium]|nr:zinc ribbon domain-containing protein [Anaerolineae bacterium]
MPSTGTLLVALALLIVVGLFILRPLLSSQPGRRERAVNQREALEAEKEAILEQIRNLDFDYETGTILETEHRQLRQELVSAAAAILQELDTLAPAAPAAAAAVDEIEAAVAQRRSQRASADIETAVAARRARTPAVAAAGNGSAEAQLAFCPQCGQATERGDRFCAYCGHQLD